MAQQYRFIVTVASICGLVQSIIWLALSIFVCLIYTCAIPVTPYAGTSDFFRVTFVKLYFEGSKCPLDGSYLGKFNHDYKNPEKINLMTPDIIFAVVIAKIIFDVAHIILCILVYNANKKEGDNKLPDLIIGWSVVTLVLSALEAFLTTELFMDVFSLTKYLEREDDYLMEPLLGGIQFIPLIFSLVSCRLVVLWLWNVVVAASFIIEGLCTKKVFSVKKQGKSDDGPSPVFPSFSPRNLPSPPIGTDRKFCSVPYRKSRSAWDLHSIESIGRFNKGPNKSKKTFPQRQTLPAKEEYIFAYGRPVESNSDDEDPANGDVGNVGEPSRRYEGTTNEAYCRDEDEDDDDDDGDDGGGGGGGGTGEGTDLPEPERKVNRFDSDERPIRIVKRRVGKPVRVPIPPPLPKTGSFVC